MNVSSVFASAGTGLSALQSKQQADRTDGAASASQILESAKDPYAEVMTKYDLQNITPAEVDQLADELSAAGHAFDKNMLMLRTRGAEFQSHAVELFGGSFDPNQPMNLIQTTKDQITMAHRYGDPTEALEQFLEYFDGFSVGSNDLTQLTLGLDRDSGIIAHLFDERNPAILALLENAIQACKKQGKYIGICGQGPSDHPDFARWLMNHGIDSVSLNPDSVMDTWFFLAEKTADEQ